ncbi:calcineurin-like phosphoesterase family protein [Kribbella amoyensis]|uniref:Calcineurin-like phosphoesterase family protein n=1 Tax=Kribbella amoyensis TaxID=996641 RepID=A0A561BTJ5_9ACTN|nr:metallophosphoesterase [Kribbella amoyensis]TWD82113.1 calcineurin-like phosphoesterase family protein [Kribbella amoyensis]
MKESRPTDLSEEQLGFRPRKAVRWLLPSVLADSGLKALLAAIFGAYADKRELQNSLDGAVYRHGDDELWFDFVADLGDGFDATYSVASQLAAPELEPADGVRLPRGELLVMGGDEVYPTASSTAYEDRTKGPYHAALPDPEKPPTLFALPGNHDWYDGLTAFLRVFAQGRPVGGWNTEQARSYFAIELPHRWWLFAIDTQFDEYIDAPQLAYFRAAAEQLQEGDGVILCTPKPAWVAAGSGGESHGYDTIRFFEREIIRPTGAVTRVMLSGDSHHYARYTERDGSAQLITSGGGGAFLSATHLLPKSLELPPKKTRVPDATETKTFDRGTTYPSRQESSRLANGIFFRLPLRNPGFLGLTAMLQTVLALFVQFGLGSEPAGIFGRLVVWAPTAFAVTAVVVGGVLFARKGLVRGSIAAVVAGFLHSLAHLALTAVWAVVLRRLELEAADWIVVVVALVVTPLLIGFVDAEIVAVYLLVACRFSMNMNEVFAGQSIEDYKNFLRLHIDPTGRLTIYPIKVPKVCHEWRADPGGAKDAPWLVPADGPVQVALIEAPIQVSREAQQAPLPV